MRMNADIRLNRQGDYCMWGFIVAIIGGLVVQPSEDMLARPVARVFDPVLKITPEEMRLFAFVLVMLIVGIITWILGSGSPFWVIFGGALGLFGRRLVSWGQEQLAKRRE